MAATRAIFERMTHKQIQLVARARQDRGCHAYYSQGYDINRVPLRLILPLGIEDKTTFQVVYEYTGDDASANTHILKLGSGLPQYHTSIAISAAYKLNYSGHSEDDYDDYGFETQTDIPGKKQGLHVLEYYNRGEGCVASVDGIPLSENGIVKRVAKLLTIFHNEEQGQKPFILWEVHFTTRTAVIYLKNYGLISHKGFLAKAGSYIEFYCNWRNEKPQIKEDNQLLAELPTVGILVPTLSVLHTTCVVTNGLYTPVVKKLTNKDHVDLSKLSYNKPYVLWSITILVGDYAKGVV